MTDIKSKKFKIIDILLLICSILPIFGVILLKILTYEPASGVALRGARVFFQIPMPIQDLYITESQLNSWAVVISILFLCLYFTHGLSKDAHTKRQLAIEWVVEKVDGMIDENMGARFASFSPFIIAMIALSAFSSLLSLFGLFPPTSDLNITAGWAILVFALITYYKLKCGPVNYLAGFASPTPILAPINFISEFATPISFAFRHYGNVLSGVVISVLIGAALQGLSGMLLGWLPGFLADIPFLQIGIPAVFSIYFDVFSGCLQAYIFAMLTMMNVSSAFDTEEFERRKIKKEQNKLNKSNKKV